jgi:hypothetical protein
MSDHQREIYHSENGDRWLLCRDDDGRVFVLHKANVSSGGTATKIELGDFLGRGKAGPEHQELARLIGGLVEDRDRDDGKVPHRSSSGTPQAGARSMKTVWIYVDTSKQVGDRDHLKVFANSDLADEWFLVNVPEGVVFEYEVIGAVDDETGQGR